ncbi:MAG: RluA family pseudouridine synthase [Bacteroidales bacterium]|nr:RluA family pseudouridine synthase [Bacteroidales bacterium]
MEEIVHFFGEEAAVVELPRLFTNPFHYRPHPLVVMAQQRLLAYFASHPEWGEELRGGKMLGVLVVRCDDGRLGFLAAFSGNLCGSNLQPGFVPPVFDMLRPGDFFRRGEALITAINHRIASIEQSDDYHELCRRAAEARRDAEAATEAHRKAMATAKARRDEARSRGDASEAALTRESQWMKAELRRIKGRHNAAIAAADEALAATRQELNALCEERKRRSAELQRAIFDHFVMLNARGEHRTLTEIFAGTPQQLPPGGAGECAAPKLLQYAFAHGLEPVAMAEFWHGASPQGEVRHHGHFYPACRGKCLPILSFMLQGLEVEPEPAAVEGQPLEILYDDDCMIAVNKPAGMLTVPGKLDAVALQQLVEASTGGEALVVHRLDQDTSGVVLFAKTQAAQRALQRQFEQRGTAKRYVALLDGCPSADGGTVSLPLRPDVDHRPQQMVDFVKGKPSITEWRVESGERRGCAEWRVEGLCRVALWPLTGRTHQLRVHCAHPQGIGVPILGDRLYNNSPKSHARGRMYLHAEWLEVTHPVTGERLQIMAPAPF